mmetsp:Transcript_97936/g.204287  ORF Transcript_97936/g.204287 Transcript_97936/m.204287 type:complete len:362 (-) Transcript_97936:489-1574(-)|eukprot:CAMPEP_0206436256 /NCGR_PEP_ID=MMETSP0324_2-20121206/10375_1 /ASSEMBLY_ACC=CAM_ASM_000836 /TAXON_ID=2866 /ORGANISM="Crypthecodinium cohnii, Strain Seligo" /LENGTH=361 /DNA_ID=CAMNT_0053903387 /DNA_START=100 /DNA_END=1185 /DNA_ORIENTATION=-
MKQCSCCNDSTSNADLATTRNAQSRKRIRARGQMYPRMHPVLALLVTALVTTPQVFSQDPQALAAPAVPQALNPGLCAANLMDILKHTTRTAIEIVFSTTLCAEERGWSGMDRLARRKENWPFHDQIGCATTVSITISNTALSLADGFSMSQTCFHKAEACGVAISQTTSYLADVSLRLEWAVQNCALPWEVPPYNAVDYPVAGFSCWAACIGTIQRIIKAAKTIDTAIEVCGDMSSIPEPPPPAEGADNGTSDGTAADGNLSASANASDASLGASPHTDIIHAGWSALSQPQPFSGFSKHLGEPIERRLSSVLDYISELVEAEDISSDYDLKVSLMDLIANVRAELPGVEGSLEAQWMLP